MVHLCRLSHKVLVLKLGLIVHHRLHPTAREVKVKFEVVLRPEELNGLDRI